MKYEREWIRAVAGGSMLISATHILLFIAERFQPTFFGWIGTTMAVVYFGIAGTETVIALRKALKQKESE